MPCPPAATAHRRLPRLARAAACLALGLGLAGCIVLPRTAEVYDPQCRSYVKQVVLEAEEVGGVGFCHGEGCLVVLAAMGIVSAASAVVSGSVAVIGNIAYWAERQGQCPADARPMAPPSASPPPQPPPPRPALPQPQA